MRRRQAGHGKENGNDQPRVFVYALSTCGHCRAAKKLLNDNGVGTISSTSTFCPEKSYARCFPK